MPICENCESEDFILDDGVYVCSVCQVASQHVQEVLEEFETGQPFVNTTKKKDTKSAKSVNKGKPWYTVEGYQVILKAQVNALIQLGCTEKLSEVTKQIWLKFVHKSGIAIIDPSISTSKKPMSSSITFRDRYLSGVLGKNYLENSLFPEAKQSYPIKIRLPTYKQSGRKREPSTSSFDSSDCDFENDFVPPVKKQKKKQKKFKDVYKDKAWRSDEEWYSLASDVNSSDSDDRDCFSLAWTSKFSSKKVKKSKSTMMCERPTAESLNTLCLLSILNIALQWCKEPISVTDLLQWVRQGYLPYIDSLQCLLPHMKLSSFDVLYMRSAKLPSYEKLIFKTKHLINYVEMPESLPDVDIPNLILRYLIQLNLPLSLMAFINQFFKVTNYKYSRYMGGRKGKTALIYAPEAAALSVIVVVCQMIFGLDDEREWELDGEVKPCTTHDGCKPFSWKEWTDYHLKRVAEIKANPRHSFESSDYEAIGDLHSYLDHWKNVVYKSCCHAKEKPAINPRKHKDAAEAKAWPFLKVTEQQGSIAEMELRKLKREYPYVFPCPSDDDYQCDRCIKPILTLVEVYDFDFVWYADSFNRVEDCFRPTPSSCFYVFDRGSWERGEMNGHLSYEFFLSVLSQVSLVDSIVIHSWVENLVRQYVSPHLKARPQQRYESTSWISNRKPGRHGTYF